MSELPGALLIGLILLLTVLSAYFSSSETAMIALNRYRLRHLVKEGNRGAEKAAQRDYSSDPDRLIGLILIGNNLVNNSSPPAIVNRDRRYDFWGDAAVVHAARYC